jgi:hypothetical protein
MILAVLAAGAHAIAPSVVGAQSCDQSQSGSCTVNVTLRAPIPFVAQISASSSTSDIGLLTASDLVPGQSSGTKTFSGPVVTAQANFAWSLTIRAANATWTYSGAGAPAKPASDLAWRVGTSGAFDTMTTSGATLMSGSLGESLSVSVNFRTTWRWTTEPPGAYELPLTLTMAAP